MNKIDKYDKRFLYSIGIMFITTIILIVLKKLGFINTLN